MADECKKDDKVTVGKDTVYGIIIVALVALLTISIFTHGFGIVPCKGVSFINYTTANGTTKIMVSGVPQLTLDKGSLPAYGQSSAPVSWITFSDYQCPFCAKLENDAVASVKSNYVSTGKVKLYWKDMPLSGHDKAKTAAIAARCANEQGKFWEMHGKIFTNQNSWSSTDASKVKTTFEGYASAIGLDSTKFSSCLSTNTYDTQISKDTNDAKSAGVSGTPGVLVVLPKDKTDYNSLDSVVKTYPPHPVYGGGMVMYQDEDNYIVLVGGAYPYSAFEALLKTVTY